jgi:class 3 adenylate cyclase
MPLTIEEMDVILALPTSSDSRSPHKQNSGEMQFGQSTTVHRRHSTPSYPAAPMPAAAPMSAAKPLPAVEPRHSMAVVFTDIVDSTNLWEEEHKQMWKALKKHDELMRAAITKFDGYEVKTCGDSFYVVFDDALQALKFCLAAQKSLHNDDSWPEKIDKIKDYHRPNKVSEETHTSFSYRGLNIRMGIHYGKPDEQRKDPKTDRWDYYGRVINTSARVQGQAKCGEIAVSDNFIQAIWRKQANAPEDAKTPLTDPTRRRILGKELALPSTFELRSMDCNLKGVKDNMNITRICWKEWLCVPGEGWKVL